MTSSVMEEWKQCQLPELAACKGTMLQYEEMETLEKELEGLKEKLEALKEDQKSLKEAGGDGRRGAVNSNRRSPQSKSELCSLP